MFFIDLVELKVKTYNAKANSMEAGRGGWGSACVTPVLSVSPGELHHLPPPILHTA